MTPKPKSTTPARTPHPADSPATVGPNKPPVDLQTAIANTQAIIADLDAKKEMAQQALDRLTYQAHLAAKK